MSRGFFTIAQGKDYVRFAYGLALSLKISQIKYSNLSIGITPEYKVPDKYKQIFDQIIEIPWGDAAKKSKWKLENEWKAIYMSPYDETIKLDADMLFSKDISNWWDILSKSEIVFATKPLTYRNEIITSDFYRKTFTNSQLPNIYTAMFYFTKCEKSFELFKLAELIYNNWQLFFYEFLNPEERPSYVSTDVVFALACKILNIQELNNNPHINVPTFVHMKTNLQNWHYDGIINIPEEWNKVVNYNLTNSFDLKIGNYLQSNPVHYHLKDFLTDDMIQTMENIVGI